MSEKRTTIGRLGYVHVMPGLDGGIFFFSDRKYDAYNVCLLYIIKTCDSLCKWNSVEPIPFYYIIITYIM